jgi:AcrR family transcriptional regulator
VTDQDTKAKILSSARILFADNGYEGTSVREIAKAADVNVALLNYHFSGKENLFFEIMQKGYNDCAEQMKRLLEENNFHIENTMVDFFRYFITNSHDLVSQFKLMLSSQHSLAMAVKGSEDSMYGPPGGMVVAEVMKRDCPDATSEDIHWGLKTLFSQVVHLSLIHNCCLKNNKDIPFSSQGDLEKGIRRVTRMVLDEIRHSRHKSSNH